VSIIGIVVIIITTIQGRLLTAFSFPTQMFSGLVDRCFDHCVDDFTTKSLISREQGCVSRCVQKFMAGSERIGQRFAEQQAQMMQQAPGGR
jgi:import inner membrane translocase subunit TIM9